MCQCFDKYVAVAHVVVYASKQLNATDIVCFSKVNRFSGAALFRLIQHHVVADTVMSRWLITNTSVRILYLSVGFVRTVQDSKAHPWSAAPPEHELHNFCQGMRGKLLVPRELYIIWDCTVLSVGFKDDFIKDCTICHFQRWLHQGLLCAIFRDDFIKDCTLCHFQRWLYRGL